MHRHDPTCLQGRVPFARAHWTPPLPRPADEGPPRGVRLYLIERVRREIAAGTYDTEEKWQLALERLVDEVSRR